MIQFSKKIIERYLSSETIFVHFTNGWCDGKKIVIETDIPFNADIHNMLESNFDQNFQIFALKNETEFLDGSFISADPTGKKLILTNPQKVLTRCGCGKSFSFKSGNEAKDKISLLRKKLKQKTTHDE